MSKPVKCPWPKCKYRTTDPIYLEKHIDVLHSPKIGVVHA